MARPIRCRSCGERFYAPVDHDGFVCQNCDESHDPRPQLEADAKALKLANTPVGNGKPQSVDPRNPTATPKKGK